MISLLRKNIIVKGVSGYFTTTFLTLILLHTYSFYVKDDSNKNTDKNTQTSFIPINKYTTKWIIDNLLKGYISTLWPTYFSSVLFSLLNQIKKFRILENVKFITLGMRRKKPQENNA